MIEFEEMIINYFMSWGRKQVIPLRNQGVTRIAGVNKDEPTADSNMAGKTSIQEALLWCLYARTLRGLKHDGVVNRHHRHDCFVSVRFRRNETRYTVIRYRRHHRFHNQLRLFRGSHPISYRHGDDTQSKLESILGCDYETFANTAIFGGAKPFALLTDSEQKKVLESFLHFEKFDLALRSTKKSLLKAEEEHHALDRRKSGIRESVSEVRGRLGSLSRAARVGEKESERERKEIERRLKKLRKVQHKYRDVSEASNSRGVEVVGEKLETLVGKLADLRSRQNAHRQRLETLQKSLHDRQKLVGKPCPACGQEVGEGSLQSFVSHVRGEKKEVKRKLKSIERRALRYAKEVSYARDRLKRVLKSHEETTKIIERSSAMQRELEKRMRKLESSGARPTPFAHEIQILSRKYSKGMSSLLMCGVQIEALETRIRDLKFWEEGFGNRGVKALIVREALPAMNEKLTEYAQEIFNGTVEIGFSPSKKTARGTDRELFHLQYKSRYGSGSYLGESTGGRKRVDICILLVFSWLSRTCNLLFCDELLDGLDSAGRETVLRILQTLRGSVFVISHEKEVKSHIGKVWTVVKHHGMSTLEEAAA